MNGYAHVKQILSADTLVLRGKQIQSDTPLKSKPGPPPEKLLSFAHITSPRMGTVKEPEKEEPFAFQSREFLRKLLIGKEVHFKVEYKTIANRDFGVLFLPSSQAVNGETNVTKILVKEGWVKVKQPEGKRELNEEQTALIELEQEAKTLGKGIWSGNNLTRTLKHTLDGDIREFLNLHKGTPINGVIEQVRDGSTYRVCLEMANNIYQTITLVLSGIKAPIYRKDVPGFEDQEEPYGEEAKYFAESRLLQRDVKIILEGTNNNSFVGTIVHPNGNIAEALLCEGLARVVDWTIAIVTGGPAKLRVAEAKAKANKLRLWKDYVQKTSNRSKTGDNSSNSTSFDGTVIRIINSDLILVLADGNKERKITLSSIKAPKTKDPKDAFYNLEAREFLRSKLIGKRVHVNVDFIKPPTEGFSEERTCGTILLNDVNISEALVSKGLATVVRHRKDDDDRSMVYDSLLIAEDRAISQSKGLHNPKEPVPVRINDASETINKAKQFLPYLVRSGNLNAIVEFCSTGGRFKLFIPSQACKITFILGGIKAPKVGRTPADKSEPFGPEALEFVNRHCLQREVEVNIDNCDKVGGFIGTLFVVINGVRQNVAITLLAEGFVTIHEYSQSPYQKDLIAAEQSAKDSRRGIWSTIDPASLVKEEIQVFNGSLRDEKVPTSLKDVVVSELGDGGKLFIQVINDDLHKLEKLMKDFSLHHSSAQNTSFLPKNGDVCSARFTLDNNWYRAKVKKINPDKTYLVSYIDFGNSETVNSSRLRPLDSKFGLNVLPPQSVEAQLAFVSVPELESEYGTEVFEHIKNLTENKNLRALFFGKDKNGVTGILLIDPKDESVGSIQERIILDGWGTVEKSVEKRFNLDLKNSRDLFNINKSNGKSVSSGTMFNVIENLMEAQEVAKKQRIQKTYIK
ncbi:hypothetical protein HDU92_005292 [Lobulomyces angularis]|nr:hypothetical protein HDU92_005292 [Lobulomyces angularis]